MSFSASGAMAVQNRQIQLVYFIDDRPTQTTTFHDNSCSNLIELLS
jgi:hypothetical protein